MKGVWKSTFREIWASLGRFTAIFAIIAMGVGFFAGLKVAREAMTDTVKSYLDNHAFYDFRLLSTLGFGQKDVDSFALAEDVKAAEGAVSFDILCRLEDGSQTAVKAMSLPETVNTPKLVAGRMPEEPGECLADSRMLTEDQIGSVLCLSQDNTSGDLENFALKEYTVVGLAQSPLYLQYERGNTSLGAGRLGGFIYLMPEGFAVDYFTEVYVRFRYGSAGESSARQSFELYSEEYDAFIQEKTGVWERLADQAVQAHRQEIYDAAEEALNQARQELEEKVGQAEEELAEAEKGLAEAAAQLAEGEAALEDAREELDQGRRTLKENEARLQEARLEIAQKETQIRETEAAIAQSEAQIRETEAAITQSEAQNGDGLMSLTEAKLQVAAGKEAIAEAKLQLADGEAGIARGREELVEAEALLVQKTRELEEGKEEYARGEREYQEGLQELREQTQQAREEIARAEAELAGLAKAQAYVLGRDTNIGYLCFQNDSGIIEGIANIFPVFFFLVAALVCITTMNRMVEEQRTQIGVLKALGFGERAVMSKYVTYSGLAALGGCVFGFFLGTWGFPEVVWFCYGIMYSADPISYVFSWQLALISLTVSLLCSIGTTWLSCRVELAQVPALLMRPKAPRAGKRVLLERLPFLWKRLGFLRKVSLRNIFRYKKRLFMMVVGISGCTALLVTGFGIKDSIADVADMQFGEIQTYDIGVSLREGADRALEQKLADLGFEEYTVVMENNMDLVTDKGVDPVTLVVGRGEEMGPFLNLHRSDGENIPYPAFGEAVVSDKLARMWGIHVGDAVTLRDQHMRTLTAVVTGVYENYIYDYVHICEETWVDQMGEEPERKTVYLNLQEPEPGTASGEDVIHEAAALLMQMEQVTNVTVNADTMERLGNMLRSLDIIVVVVIFCAAGLAFIVLYNLTNINITERIREIATIKVLGFYRKETAAYVFRENVLLTAMGLALGLVLGRGLHWFVMNEIQVDMMNFVAYVKPVSYLYSGVLTLVFAWFVNRVMGRKLEHISMTESLKSVD